MKNFNKKIKLNRGMTIIELVVVLSIFAVLSMVTLFNSNNFQRKVDIRNLATDIASQIVQAQNSSLSGLFPTQFHPVNWKPAYGVFFAVQPTQGADSKDFIYFTDTNSNNLFDNIACSGECINKYTITKGNYISSIDAFYTNSTTSNLSNLTIVFTRPNSSPVFHATTFNNGLTVSYVQITIIDATGKNTTKIQIYNSGRVQIS